MVGWGETDGSGFVLDDLFKGEAWRHPLGVGVFAQCCLEGFHGGLAAGGAGRVVHLGEEVKGVVGLEVYVSSETFEEATTG